jgi:hypothetical protein
MIRLIKLSFILSVCIQLTNCQSNSRKEMVIGKWYEVKTEWADPSSHASNTICGKHRLVLKRQGKGEDDLGGKTLPFKYFLRNDTIFADDLPRFAILSLTKTDMILVDILLPKHNGLEQHHYYRRVKNFDEVKNFE